MTNSNQRSLVKFYRKTFWNVVAILALGVPQLATAESRSDRLDDSGWGLGAKVAIPLVSTRDTVKLTAGVDMGNLESRIGEGTELGTGFATTQDYQRIFGGAEIGRKLDARIRPHLGANVVLLRQDLSTHFLDTSTGEHFVGRRDSGTRLSYDLSAGLGIGITPKTGLDAGVRYVDGLETRVPDTDGSLMTTRPDYLQFYLGVTHRFAWPQGQ
jgi:opacity protein-like surface antigen